MKCFTTDRININKLLWNLLHLFRYSHWRFKAACLQKINDSTIFSSKPLLLSIFFISARFFDDYHGLRFLSTDITDSYRTVHCFCPLLLGKANFLQRVIWIFFLTYISLPFHGFDENFTHKGEFYDEAKINRFFHSPANWMNFIQHSVEWDSSYGYMHNFILSSNIRTIDKTHNSLHAHFHMIFYIFSSIVHFLCDTTV